MAAEVNPILDTLDNNTKIFDSDCDKIKESFQDLKGEFQRPMQMNIFQHLPNEVKQFQIRKMKKLLKKSRNKNYSTISKVKNRKRSLWDIYSNFIRLYIDLVFKIMEHFH